jgi:hypothetical protein
LPCFGGGGGGVVTFPVVGLNPKTYNNIVTITVININGINTIIQDTTPIPDLHNKFNKTVIIIITINLKKAVLYNPLKVSIMICVKENTR